MTNSMTDDQAQRLQRRMRGFRIHCMVFAAAAAAAVGATFLMEPTVPWLVFALVGWGPLLALHTAYVMGLFDSLISNRYPSETAATDARADPEEDEPQVREDAPQKTVRVLIEGRVQGVWYRGWTVDEANRRGLAGWVRNRSDGSVEALFSGPAPTVDSMLEACWNGPTSARVNAVKPEPAEAPNATGFRPLPTQ